MKEFMDLSGQPEDGAPGLESALQHLGWVRQLAAAIVGGGADADDVAQEAWRRALENPPPTSVGWKAWLGGIVRHTARDRGRAERRRARREADVAEPEHGRADASALLERVEEERALVRLVTAMEEPYRTLILRRFFDGWSITKIALVEAAPEATIRTRLRRGLERLRESAIKERGAGAERWLAGMAFIRLPPSTTASTATVLSSWTFIPTVLLMLKAFALFAAVAAVTLLVLGPDSMNSREQVEIDEPASATPAESLVAVTGGASRWQSATVAPAHDDSEIEVARVSERAAPGQRGVQVQGQVLTGEVPLEAEGCRIGIRSLDPYVKSTVSAEIGPGGRFEFFVGEEFAIEGERVLAKLVGEGLFGVTQIELELRPEWVVKLPPTLLAHGRFSTTPALPLGEAFVHFSDGDGAWFLGHCEVEPSGRFALPIRPHPWVSEIRITVYSNGRTVLEDVVELAALTSVGGLHYDFEMSVVELVVRDPEGQRVPGAELVLDSVRESQFQQPGVEIGSEASIQLNLPIESFQYVVKAPGFEPKLGRFDVEEPGSKAQRVEVVLREASLETAAGQPVRLYGTVTLGGTRRVGDAFVSASATADSWSIAHALYFEGVRTDENGEYELMLPRPGWYMLTASHRDGPMSETRPLSVSHEQRFDVDLTPESRVFLRPTGAVEELPQTHGLVEWQRVQDPGRSVSLNRTGWPYALTVRPDRSYRVMGRLIGTGLFGVTRLEGASMAQERPVPVTFVQATIASGTLVTSAGAPVVGARIVASPGAGAYRLAPVSWRSAVTDEAGGFEVHALGNFDGETRVEITVNGGPWGPRSKFTVNTLEHATLTLE